MSMDVIHVWAGLYPKSKEEFEDYFNQFPQSGICRFCQDIDKEWIDFDFIGFYFNENSDDLDLAIEETPDSALYEQIREACIKRGVLQANAMFYYTNSDITITEPNKTYNELKYIGCFDWPDFDDIDKMPR